MKIRDEILKVQIEKKAPQGAPGIYPWNILPLLPDEDCVFDAFRGTIGFDVYPFSVTTRVSASSQIFIKVYEEQETESDIDGGL